MTKVLLIDDDEDVHALVREQIRISDLPNIDLISALSGREGVQKYTDEGAQVVLMDMKMPQGDGVFATKQIIKHDPKAKIFIVTAYPSSTDAFTSMDLGAIGVIKKAGQYTAFIIAVIVALSQGGMVD